MAENSLASLRFVYPWMIWLLPLVCIALAWNLRSARRRAKHKLLCLSELYPSAPYPYFDLSALKFPRLRLCFQWAIALSLTLAAMRPYHEQNETALESSHGVDVLLLLDVSSSMLATDVTPSGKTTRLALAKTGIKALLQKLQHSARDRVGLVAFAGTAVLICPMTQDYDALATFVEDLDIDSISRPGTDLGAAIDTSLAALARAAANSSAVFLLTDGEDLADSVETAVAHAAAQHVRIYTVGFGNVHGAPIPDPRGYGFRKNAQGELILSRLDAKSLEHIAQRTGGFYTHANALQLGLVEAYEHMHNHVVAAERALSQVHRIQWEHYVWPLGLAWLLLALEALLPQRWDMSRRNALMALAIICGCSAPAWAEAYHPQHQKWLDAFAQQPTPTLRLQLAYSYRRAGDCAAAEALLQPLIDSPHTEERYLAQFNMGVCAFFSGKLHEAVAAFQLCLDERPQDNDAKKNLELAQKELERLEKGEIPPPPQKKQQQQQQQQNKQNQQNKPSQDNPQQSNAAQNPNSGKDADAQPDKDATATKDTPPKANPEDANQQGQDHKPATQPKDDAAKKSAGTTPQDANGNPNPLNTGNANTPSGSEAPLTESEAKRILRQVHESRRRFQPKPTDKRPKRPAPSSLRGDW
jgi:Ca-activated chloride channel family protein